MFRSLIEYAGLTSLTMSALIAGPQVAQQRADSGLVQVEERGAMQALQLPGIGAFHMVKGELRELRSFALPDSGGVVVTWSEVDEAGRFVPYYAISKTGARVDVVREARHEVRLRNREFVPIPSELLPEAAGVYIVQFVTRPLESYRQQLRALGVRVERFLAHQNQLTRMSAAQASLVAELDCVRWVGPYLTDDRIEPVLLNGLSNGTLDDDQRYTLQVFARGLGDKSVVADAIVAAGGSIESMPTRGYFLRARIPSASLRAVAALEQVLWIDRHGEPIPLMNNARELGGANFIEQTLGFNGTGVRGEVLDFGVKKLHQEFQAHPLIVHTPSPAGSHGTATTSEVFASGVDPMARGMLPDGQGIIAGVFNISDAYTHRQELTDPLGPYRASFQSNSWGYLPLSSEYTNRTTEIDDAVVQTGLLVIWGQGNEGTQIGLQEPWAKNVVSVGGFLHGDTLSIADDMWGQSGSIGPATDGRIKPDLTAFYDNIYVALDTNTSAYSATFGGTSGATPIVAGHHGIFLQMWHEGVFGNMPTGATVFESSPHWTTSKAVMINTATPFDFSGQGHDFTRMHQGWGRPDLQRLYDRREQLLIVDETDVLANLESTEYEVHVTSTNRSLRATLVYEDMAGTTSSSLHRVNDLTLKVTSPTGVTYWGNVGLLDGNASVSGGVANTVDTVENVFVESPEIGLWTVEVIASEVNADTHMETTAVDADYALVVSGFDCRTPQVYCTAAPGLICGTPSIETMGLPSATANSGYLISAGPARGQSPGILLYTDAGSQALPFLGGTLCLQVPLRRSVVVNSGGTLGACDGFYTIDRNAFARGLLGGHPAAFLSVPGTTVYSQWWGRDGSGGGSFLSNAVVEVICD